MRKKKFDKHLFHLSIYEMFKYYWKFTVICKSFLGCSNSLSQRILCKFEQKLNYWFPKKKKRRKKPRTVFGNSSHKKHLFHTQILINNIWPSWNKKIPQIYTRITFLETALKLSIFVVRYRFDMEDIFKGLIA